MASSSAPAGAVLAIGLVIGLAGCAQGHAPVAAPEPPHAPVATLGPDDGMPFVPSSAHPGAKATAGRAPAIEPVEATAGSTEARETARR